MARIYVKMYAYLGGGEQKFRQQQLIGISLHKKWKFCINYYLFLGVFEKSAVFTTLEGGIFESRGLSRGNTV